jgi:SAM-dependent methyltransferase
MWRDYGTDYSYALRDDAFLAWREIGARQKAQNIVHVCRSIKVKSVIEIGCGTGAVLRALYGMKFAETYAVADVAIPAVHFAWQSFPSNVARAAACSATALPFQSNAFDLAILSHVLEHLENPVWAVREAARVARFLVVEVPTEKVLSNLILTRLFRQPYASIRGSGHIQFWSPSSITSFLTSNCGVRILKRHRDLLSGKIEMYGKRGINLAKPLLKEMLKFALPGYLYSRLLTTHSIFLCRHNEAPL